MTLVMGRTVIVDNRAGANGIMVAAKTPREVIARLNEGLVKSLNERDLREKLLARGAEPLTNTPAQFTAFLAEDMKRWAKVAKGPGIKVE